MTHPSVHARTYPNKIAYQMAGTGKAITYRELDELSNQGAQLFRSLGLKAGDAKILRNPGGRVTPQAMEALVLAVHLLNVNRVLIVPHAPADIAGLTTIRSPNAPSAASCSAAPAPRSTTLSETTGTPARSSSAR